MNTRETVATETPLRRATSWMLFGLANSFQKTFSVPNLSGLRGKVKSAPLGALVARDVRGRRQLDGTCSSGPARRQRARAARHPPRSSARGRQRRRSAHRRAPLPRPRQSAARARASSQAPSRSADERRRSGPPRRARQPLRARRVSRRRRRPRAPASEDDRRAVVHRVVEDAAREDDAVDDRRGDADVDPLVELLQHPTRGRAVEVQRVADASVDRRDHVRLSVDDEADVADERLVEDRVDRLAVVDAAPDAVGRACARPIG